MLRFRRFLEVWGSSAQAQGSHLLLGGLRLRVSGFRACLGAQVLAVGLLFFFFVFFWGGMALRV